MDGTHSTCPKQFKQLFVIRAPLGDTCVSVVYALLPSKEQEVYEVMLTALLDVCLQQNIRPKPERVMADFEKAIQNAAQSTLNHDGNLHVQGCFYHLTQSTWRRVQSEGLQNDYHNSEAVKEFCGKIDGLAFLPECDVKEGIAILYDEVPDNLRCLVEYLDTTYVNGPLRAVEVAGSVNLRFRRLPPI